MDFFNKLGKKASEAAQITKDKTAKLSGELKLRSQINDSKSKINNLYTEIGKLVFAGFEASEKVSDEELKAKCEEIVKLNEEITKAENDILALKDIKKCVSCGAEVGLGVDFCPKCGKEQPKVEVAEVVEEVKEESNEEEKTEE